MADFLARPMACGLRQNHAGVLCGHLRKEVGVNRLMSATWPSEHIRPRTDSGEERSGVSIREEVRTRAAAGTHGATLMASPRRPRVTRKMLPANYRRPQYRDKTTYG
jgi:hypothetical protein